VETVLKVLFGAVTGGAVGFLAGRARLCSSDACRGRANMAASILGWAVFGAALAWWAMR
jgi:hypothetical protein